MAKQRATLEKKPKNDTLPALKTVELWCDTCHTKWVEGCFQAWAKCPFTDCKGTLRNFQQRPPVPRPKFQKDKSMPLLVAMEGRNDAA